MTYEIKDLIQDINKQLDKKRRKANTTRLLLKQSRKIAS